MSEPETKRTEHHVWCNYFSRPVEGCTMCPGLWAKYPYDNREEAASSAFILKHFPNVTALE